MNALTRTKSVSQQIQYPDSMMITKSNSRNEIRLRQCRAEGVLYIQRLVAMTPVETVSEITAAIRFTMLIDCESARGLVNGCCSSYLQSRNVGFADAHDDDCKQIFDFGRAVIVCDK